MGKQKRNKQQTTNHSLIEGWCDGACEPMNPGGHASWGAVLKIDGVKVWSAGGYCGVGPEMSNKGII
jgi:hypothetical protein